LQGLAPNDHAVLFYSDISAKRELVFPFLQEALDKEGVAVNVTEHEFFEKTVPPQWKKKRAGAPLLSWVSLIVIAATLFMIYAALSNA
jgi:hypothetical protein